jgi:hypothetical protein
VKILKIAALVVLATLGVVALIAPIGPMPGFFIGGNAAAAPARWDDTSDVHEIRLKVPGMPPRVVIIWVVEHGGDLYVVGSRDSGWVKMIGEGAPVEMRLGDDTYALHASLLKEGWQPILEAYVAKYRPDYPDVVAGFPTIDEAKDLVAVYRLGRG